MWKAYKDKWKKNFAIEFGDRSGLCLFFFMLELIAVSFGLTTLWLILIVASLFGITLLVDFHILSAQAGAETGIILNMALSAAFYIFTIATEAGNKLLIKITEAVEQVILHALFRNKRHSQIVIKLIEIIHIFKSNPPSAPYIPPRVRLV